VKFPYDKTFMWVRFHCEWNGVSVPMLLIGVMVTVIMMLW